MTISDDWQSIETAPMNGEIWVRAPGHEPIKAIWYFGDWGTTEPIMGDRLDFEPTEWRSGHDDKISETPMEREEVARMVLTVAQQCAAGYRRNATSFDPPEAHDVAEKCAIAASNTGYFILIAMGFLPKEILQLKNGGHGELQRSEEK